MSSLEKEFHRAMINIYQTGKREIGYNATRFLQLVGEKGGVVAAKQLISNDNGTSGFTTLFENNRLDLSVEAHVLIPKYKELFTDEEIEMSRNRLKEYGYDC